MILWHGTSEYGAQEILKSGGIRPRGETGIDNWEHTVGSNPKAVYLTNAYPCHFALCARSNSPRTMDENGKLTKRIAVFEIDTAELTPGKLHPDEDALEQAGRKYDGIQGNMKERTLIYREKARHNPNWEASLKAMGTCAYYGGIPLRHIKRVAYFDPRKNRDMQMMMMDGSISVMAYQICGHLHRNYTRWLFGETITPDDISIGGLPEVDPSELATIDPERLKEVQKTVDHWKGYREHLEKVLANREGIEVVNVTSDNKREIGSPASLEI